MAAIRGQSSHSSKNTSHQSRQFWAPSLVIFGRCKTRVLDIFGYRRRRLRAYILTLCSTWTSFSCNPEATEYISYGNTIPPYLLSYLHWSFAKPEALKCRTGMSTPSAGSAAESEQVTRLQMFMSWRYVEVHQTAVPQRPTNPCALASLI